MAELSYRLETVVGVPVLFDVPGPGHRSATPAEVALFGEVARLQIDQARLADAVAAAYVERDAARGALRGLVEAIAPESGACDTCRACSCSMPEFDEAHAPGCAYLVARKLLGLPEIGQPDDGEEATP